MYDLSILIPARNEMFLARTVQDILTNKRASTEVIIVLDGEWADPPLEQHPDVTVLYNYEPVGQRAATNQAARLSTAKYVMKCDAHISFAPGFDEELINSMQDDWTVVPKMYNLHVFDWVCSNCGHRTYQGPTPECCSECKGQVTREMIWKPKNSPETTSMRFDRSLRFQYWSDYKSRQEGDLVETMSLLGACWMLTREKYWELNICDEEHGSWGQQGTEVACKTWLSGGKLICNKRTWFAHLFRTQGGDFGFPYPQSGKQIEHARAYSRRLWLGGEWKQAKYPLEWLIEKFAPVPDWDVSKGIVFYTDNRLQLKLAKLVQGQLKQQGLPIVSASLKPMGHFGKNIHLPLKRGALTMFKQILAALEASDSEVIFLCEHDVLYHPSHFEFSPEKDDVFYYNVHVFQLLCDEGVATIVDDRRQTSGLCANRQLLIAEYRERVARAEAGESGRSIGYEPGTRDGRSDIWRSDGPNVDLRHGGNMTVTKRSPDDFRRPHLADGWTVIPAADVPGWNDLEAVAGLVAFPLVSSTRSGSVSSAG